MGTKLPRISRVMLRGAAVRQALTSTPMMDMPGLPLVPSIIGKMLTVMHTQAFLIRRFMLKTSKNLEVANTELYLFTKTLPLSQERIGRTVRSSQYTLGAGLARSWMTIIIWVCRSQ